MERGKRVIGWALHVVVGGLMIFAGLGKLLGFAPPEVFEGLKRSGLGEQIYLIGAGELAAAALLLIPRTSSLGILLTSSFWGGVICFHMAHGEAYGSFATFLVLAWLGAYLRNPATLSSFFSTRSGAVTLQHAEPVTA